MSLYFIEYMLMRYHTIAPNTHLPMPLRIFKTNKNHVVFYDKFPHLFHEATFLSENCGAL